LIVAAALFFTREGWLGSLKSEQRPVFGVAEFIENKVERKGSAEASFTNISQNDEVYLADTIVTAPNGRGRIKTEDGSTVELFPGSRVILNKLDASGVEVTVLEGEIEAVPVAPISIRNAAGNQIRSKERVRLAAQEVAPPAIAPPAAAPSQTPPASTVPELSQVTPNEGQVFKLKPGTRDPSLIVPLEWQASGSGDLNLLIGREAFQGVEQPKATLTVPSQTGANRFELKIQGPGTYQFSLSAPGGSAVDRRFIVESSFIALAPPQVKLTDEKFASNRWDGSARGELGATASWGAYPGAVRYSVESGTKRWFVRKNSVTLQAGDIDLSNPTLRVSAWLPSGFEPRSPQVKILSVSAPEPKLPPHGSTHSLAKQTRVVLKRGVLLTWERTHYSKGYEIEINKKAYKTAGNFYVIESPVVGQVQWRVRALGALGATPWSKTRLFTLAR
jgi:hypothetical protein